MSANSASSKANRNKKENHIFETDAADAQPFPYTSLSLWSFCSAQSLALKTTYAKDGSMWLRIVCPLFRTEKIHKHMYLVWNVKYNIYTLFHVPLCDTFWPEVKLSLVTMLCKLTTYSTKSWNCKRKQRKDAAVADIKAPQLFFLQTWRSECNKAVIPAAPDAPIKVNSMLICQQEDKTRYRLCNSENCANIKKIMEE